MLAAFWLTLAMFESSLAAAAVAGAAVSVPVIIHLLNRKRFRVVSWAAMRFLLAAQRKNSRRMRLEQLILLAVRCLVLLLLILAACSVTGWAERFWRFLMPNAVVAMNGSSQRTHKIIVIDGSVSMGVKAVSARGDETAFTRALALASKLVRESPRGDSFSVVLLASPPRRVVPEPSEDGKKVAGEIEALRLPHGNADLLACLNVIDSLLQSSPGKFPDKEVYFFTDLQKSTWLSGQVFNLSPHLRRSRTILVDSGVEKDVPNVAVTNFFLNGDLATTGRTTSLQATLHNFSSETRKDVEVKLFYGSARAAAGDAAFDWHEVGDAKQKVTLQRNEDTTVSFSYKFKTPGDHALQVRVAGDDLTPDDVRTVVLNVKKELSVLLVNGKSFGDPFDQSTGWLQLALNPGEGTSVVKTKTINAFDFGDEGKGTLNPIVDGKVEPYDCVFLCDVPSLNAGAKRRLDAHLRRGGGVIFCLGGQVKAGEYNAVLFQEGAWVLPVPLVASQGSGTLHRYQFALEQDSDRTPPLQAFKANSDRTTLLASRLTRFWQTGNPPPGFKPRRVLSFSPAVIPGKEKEARDAKLPPGGAAIYEWNPPAPADPQARKEGTTAPPPGRVRGRVVLLTTGVNSDWGNWPASPSYPALMHELLYFASTGVLQEQSLEVGQGIDLYLPTKASGLEARIELPGGRVETAPIQKLDDGNVLHWTDTDQSGVYRIQVGVEPRDYLFAVNVPAQTPSRQGSEGDLTRCTREELQKVYPDWEMQVVRELKQIVRTSLSNDPTEQAFQPLGTAVAGWLLIVVLALVLAEVVLAFVFGHYTTRACADRSAGATEEPKPLAASRKVTWALRVLAAMPWALLVVGLGLGYFLIEEAATGDLFHFFPGFRHGLERLMGVKVPAPGEGSHWRLEYDSFFIDKNTDPWLGVGVLLLGAGLVWFIYRREGQKPILAQRLVLMGLRLGLVVLLLVVLLPQLKLHFERQGWPNVVLLIDDSYSMSAREMSALTDVREAADNLASEAARLASDKRTLAKKKEEQALQWEDMGQKRTPDDPERTRLLKDAGLLHEQARLLEADADALDRAKTGADLQRLHLLQALTTRNDLRWLRQLSEQRKVKIHVYHCSTLPAKLAQVTTEDDVPEAGNAILAVTAGPRNDSSRLGASVRQVIKEFSGSSLSAIIMLTDGVTTEGEDLPKVSKYARSLGIPLYFVGVGDNHPIRDVYPHDLNAPEGVIVNDRVRFSVKVAGKGYKGLTVPVELREKGKAEVLDRKEVRLPDEKDKDADVELVHQPTEAGKKVYVISTPVREDEDEKDNNRLEKAVTVRANKLIKVLYVEGYRRYEYHFLKTLLERESNRVKDNKTLELKVRLLDADPGYVQSDRSALAEFPTLGELESEYHVVILGDVDPQGSPQTQEFLTHVAHFVEKHGGGLLMIAGERFSPRAYRNSPLKDVLPVEMVGDEKEEPDQPRDEGYHLELTPAGRVHPFFQPTPGDKDKEDVWSELRPMYWWADGYVPKRAAEALAVHPTAKASVRPGAIRDDKDGLASGKHPLVVQQFFGSGRSMFFGFGETWRWGHRESQARYNNFWIQTVRYLAYSRLGDIDLKLDRQTNYRRGDPIKVTVRFPDDKLPKNPADEVKVVVERKLPGKDGQREVRTMKLERPVGSRTAYQGTLDQTPEGEYAFTLSTPAQPDPKPRAECKVVGPPGEMYGLRMNQPEMEEAARESRGKFYTLATADQVLEDLEVANRVTVSSAGKPMLVWNKPLIFVIALLLLSTEWLLRKRMNLL